MEELLKKIFLAGIGSLAITYEKANNLIQDMVEKGKITVEQGKKLNEELKRVVEDNKTDVQNNTDIENKIKNYIDSLNLATKEDLKTLSNRIDELEKIINMEG
ncbi:polyhydroxyalkanoate synthesis regulator phasin [Keratinibaculum paraultunense]|uniref:Polyhydroxyalkanoate synthesis regulator phasin n=1 Tax=Keratinibaculum paraultunense TaxID=1278232 RepID=A0A4R3KUD4_9FIRM|nr:phasin family protein [Keratinibaculum paraultunense]QQY79836.1 phasin family protein [Keratinibaculum paraultunense]TCS88718.1 polyhydroxyalkanoate synthesis regulator phasin [Keratinibaculum paraultunense]